MPESECGASIDAAGLGLCVPCLVLERVSRSLAEGETVIKFGTAWMIGMAMMVFSVGYPQSSALRTAGVLLAIAFVFEVTVKPK